MITRSSPDILIMVLKKFKSLFFYGLAVKGFEIPHPARRRRGALASQGDPAAYPVKKNLVT